MALDLVRVILFPALIAFAASSDLLTMTIPNRVSLAMAAGFLVVALWGGMPLADIGLHIAAAAMVLVIAFALFAMGWIGGGDAKMAAAVALWLGFDSLLDYVLLASVFGGGLTALILFFRSYPMPFVTRAPAWLMRLHDNKTGIPYGIALAAAALVIYPHTPFMTAVDVSRFVAG